MNMVVTQQDGLMGTGMDAEWLRVLHRLRAEFDDSVFNSWFKPMALVNIEEGCAVMATPTRFMRNWLETNYADRIRSAWQSENASVRDISFVVMSGFAQGNNGSSPGSSVEKCSQKAPEKNLEKNLEKNAIKIKDK